MVCRSVAKVVLKYWFLYEMWAVLDRSAPWAKEICQDSYVKEKQKLFQQRKIELMSDKIHLEIFL